MTQEQQNGSTPKPTWPQTGVVHPIGETPTPKRKSRQWAEWADVEPLVR